MKALIFDCDGVLVDTEKDGHRVAFNEAFKQAGMPAEVMPFVEPAAAPAASAWRTAVKLLAPV